MITWLLWERLFQHQRHPLFKRIYFHAKPNLNPSTRAMTWLAGGLVIVGIALSIPLIVFIPAIFALLALSVIFLPLLLMLFNGSVFGLYLATISAGWLARERQTGRYDLLRLLPRLEPDIEWVIVSACAYRHNAFPQLTTIVRGLALLVAGLILLLSGVIVWLILINPAPIWEKSFPFGDLLSNGAIGIGAVLILYADHMQGILLGGLVGLIAPAQAHEPYLSQVWAVLLYVTVQAVAYVTIAVLVLLSVDVCQRLFVDADVQVIATMSLAVLITYLVRESLIEGLYQVWQRQNP